MTTTETLPTIRKKSLVSVVSSCSLVFMINNSNAESAYVIPTSCQFDRPEITLPILSNDQIDSSKSENFNLFACLNKLKLISQLEKDWNGYGAEEISKVVIQKTKLIIERLQYVKFDIFPTAQNSIQLEVLKNDTYLEIQVFENEFELYIESNEGNKDELFSEIGDLTLAIGKYYG